MEVISYKDVPVGTVEVLFYEFLSEDAKSKARKVIVFAELSSFRRAVSEYREQGIHAKVNSKKLRQLIKLKHLIDSLADVDVCEAFVAGNLCHFLSDGTYIKYS